MNRALCWKEWREHRQIWLAVALLAVLLVGMPTWLLARGALSARAAGEDAWQTLSLAFILAVAGTYGLLCGSMLFAGEREADTQVFLDTLTGRRALLWTNKCTLGLALAVAQVVFLAALDRLLVGGTSYLSFWSLVGVMLLLSLDCFAWGLYASALCPTVLTAVGVGLVLWLFSWLPAILLDITNASKPDRQLLAVGLQMLLTAGAAIDSWRIYCYPDRERRLSPGAAALSSLPVLLWLPVVTRRCVARAWPSRRALLWLILRQGRARLVVLTAGMLLLGMLAPFNLLLIWPPATLVLGILCGVSVFSGDQAGLSYCFLGSQRLSPGLVWRVKVLCWLSVTGILIAAAGLLVCLHRIQEPFLLELDGPLHFQEIKPIVFLAQRLSSPTVFIILWPLYGFAVGQLCAQVCRRLISALIIALLAGMALAFIWAPSLVEGGLVLWQVLGVPVLFLAATRFSMWAWLGDRRLTRRPLLGLVGCCLLALAWIAGILWYRVAEVPTVGVPFDVPAFLAGLPAPEKNEAGPLIRKAADELGQYDDARSPHYKQIEQVLQKGWPPGESDLGPWLDHMFEGQWAKDYEKGAGFPLGMVFDPRLGRTTPDFTLTRSFNNASSLFAARALQLQIRQEDTKALDLLMTVLALSRQLRHLAADPFLYMSGEEAESNTLKGVDQWLGKLGPRKPLLRRALERLEQHEAETPDLVGSLQAAYVAARSHKGPSPPLIPSSPEHELWWLASQVPWEKERDSKLLDALFKIQLGWARLSYPDLAAQLRKEGTRDWEQLRGLSGSHALGFCTRVWIRQSDWGSRVATSRCQARGTLLQAALMLYQVERGGPAEALQDLVPEYLKKVPLDPFTGYPFHYYISGGEAVDKNGGITQVSGTVMQGLAEGSHQVAPGQGVLWYQPPYGEVRIFLVPLATAH